MINDENLDKIIQNIIINIKQNKEFYMEFFKGEKHPNTAAPSDRNEILIWYENLHSREINLQDTYNSIISGLNTLYANTFKPISKTEFQRAIARVVRIPLGQNHEYTWTQKDENITVLKTFLKENTTLLYFLKKNLINIQQCGENFKYWRNVYWQNKIKQKKQRIENLNNNSETDSNIELQKKKKYSKQMKVI